MLRIRSNISTTEQLHPAISEIYKNQRKNSQQMQNGSDYQKTKLN